MTSLQVDAAGTVDGVRLSLARRVAAEAIGTALLVAAVIGSGISASRLSPGDVGLQLFENAMATAVAVGAYIAGAYFFTSSTSFANPAVTVARSLSDTFAGIAPASVVPFLLMEALGGALGYLLVRWWFGAGARGLGS